MATKTAAALNPKRINDPVRQARVDLAAAFRLAARWDWQEGIGGHFSMRLPGDDELFLLNPLGVLWSEIRASDLLVVDIEGNKVDGEGEVERTAFCIHGAIHKAGVRNHCVIHTHTPYATAMATLKSPRFEFIHQGGLRFYDDIAYDPEFNGLVTADEEGERIAKIMGEKRAVFLANHGTIVTGETVGEALQYTYVLERNCMYQAIARMHGTPLQPVSDKVGRETREVYKTDPVSPDVYFTALKRTLDRENSDYAQ
ncbi:MAG: hypothetical protein EXQ86_06730 [Rhodospirillales bacterium]|nr:hypothetical protein [Rhodospirillales bacterium]